MARRAGTVPRKTGGRAHEAGYGQEDISRAQYLVQKRGLKRDAETQCLEDVICLVFIEHYLDEFASKHQHDKLIAIIQKTWGKMSPEGQAAALGIPLSKPMQALVGEALAG